MIGEGTRRSGDGGTGKSVGGVIGRSGDGGTGSPWRRGNTNPPTAAVGSLIGAHRLLLLQLQVAPGMGESITEAVREAMVVVAAALGLTGTRRLAMGTAIRAAVTEVTVVVAAGMSPTGTKGAMVVIVEGTREGLVAIVETRGDTEATVVVTGSHSGGREVGEDPTRQLAQGVGVVGAVSRAGMAAAALAEWSLAATGNNTVWRLMTVSRRLQSAGFSMAARRALVVVCDMHMLCLQHVQDPVWSGMIMQQTLTKFSAAAQSRPECILSAARQCAAVLKFLFLSFQVTTHSPGRILVWCMQRAAAAAAGLRVVISCLLMMPSERCWLCCPTSHMPSR